MFAQAKQCHHWLRAFSFHQSEQELTTKQNEKQSHDASVPPAAGGNNANLVQRYLLRNCVSKQKTQIVYSWLYMFDELLEILT